MAAWKETLDLRDVWKKSWDADNIHNLGNIIAERIRKLKSYDKGDWIFNDDCVERFENIGPTQSYEDLDYGPVEDFDMAMPFLYDWADENRIWVATNF